jgi:hypothetical protein
VTLIEVRPRSDDPLRFSVVVSDGGGRARHEVSVSQEDLDRLRAPKESPDAFIHRCFEFLLQREPKESILGTFDISVISRYFPEFEQTIRK